MEKWAARHPAGRPFSFLEYRRNHAATATGEKFMRNATRLMLVGTVLVGTGLTLGACATGERAVERGTLVATSNACMAQRFEVYFADGEARLTESAREAIGLTATMLQGCDIQRVQVLGLADARGGASANQSLSERRATAVAEALAAAGWPTPVFDVSAAGDQGAQTPDGVSEPLRRRTEVLVTAAPR